MDREQHELQFLGFCGTFKQSFHLILSWRKIFSQITLALILPLSFIFLAHFQISQLIFFKILSNEDRLSYSDLTPRDAASLRRAVSSEWTYFWLFKAAYFTFLLIFSLLSTAAIVYTIACIFTTKPISFRKVMKIVPKVWKRLAVTFLWSFAVVLVYNVLAIGLLVLWIILLGSSPAGFAVAIVFLLAYLAGFVYIGIIWHLASVVSVLEDSYGIKAMKKSIDLIKGKLGLAVAYFVLIGICFGAIEVIFENFVVIGVVGGFPVRIVVGIVCFLLLFKVILFELVIQSVIYFVCKSYHHENIDKSSLSDHLEVYLGDYVPLKSKDFQLGEVNQV